MLKIPKLFHQIWVGPNPLPEDCAGYQKSWLRLNPGWELRLWTEDVLPTDLIRKEIYDKQRVPAERADLLRLEVLYRFGGVYVDADFECLKAFEPLIDGLDFFVGDLKPGRINNALIGSVPGHRILEQAIREARTSVYHVYDKAAAGPLFLDSIVKQYPGVKVFEQPVFYPNTPSQREQAYAYHYAARTWQDAAGFEKAARRAEDRVFKVQVQYMEVVQGIEDLMGLPEAEPLRGRLKALLARATFHKSLPTAQDSKATLKARFRSRAGRVRRALSSLMTRLRTVAAKRWLRGLFRLASMVFRPTYATRLDLVLDRDELPEVLNRRALLGVGVEIGVKTGKFSEYLLEHWKGAKLVSVDPWLEDAPEKYIDVANVPQSEQERFLAITRERLARFGDRSGILRMTSADAAPQFKSGSLDFVYIDARHDYESVREDLHLWFDKVRPGGIIAGHDYADGEFRQGLFGVKRAVDEFFKAKGLAVNSTRGQWPVEMFATWIVEIPASAPALPREAAGAAAR